MDTNKFLVIIIILVVFAASALYYFTQSPSTDYEATPTTETSPGDDAPIPVEPDGGIGDGAEPLPEDTDEPMAEATGPREVVLGESAGGNSITAYQYGSGETEVLFVGGVHGGYSYNTAALGYELVDYFASNPSRIPDGLTVTVIPVVNPDGLQEIVGTTGRFDVDDVTASDEARVAGRFNANEVDINRNFDCEWQANATWQNRSVSGGTAPFSEPEAAAIRDYVAANTPDAAVVYYSQAGGVYASTCRNGIDPMTADLVGAYADASGYPAYEEFDYYEITGDMVNWMASEGIPAISVLLTNHETTEWSKNRAGVEAVLNLMAQ